jgi:hypothetical protein
MFKILVLGNIHESFPHFGKYLIEGQKDNFASTSIYLQQMAIFKIFFLKDIIIST